MEGLRAGDDLVMGSRLRGRIEPGAMPLLHRIGNPVLSGILQLFFRGRVSDPHCGMRAFSKEAFHRMRLTSGGMEFASEMVIKASLAGMRISDIPIMLSRDGRTSHGPHLRSFRDGWRHLRYMLLLSPTYLFVIPGSICMLLGLIPLILLGHGPAELADVRFDYHYMILGSLMTILGFQAVMTGLFAKAYCHAARLFAPDRILETFRRHFSLERGLIIGTALLLAGFIVDAQHPGAMAAQRHGRAQRDPTRDASLDPDDHRRANQLLLVLPEPAGSFPCRRRRSSPTPVACARGNRRADRLRLNPLRILFVYDCLYPHTIGGFERFYRDVATRLARRHEVTYLTRVQWDDGEAPDIPEGVKLVALNCGRHLYTTSGRRRILPPVVFGLGVLNYLMRQPGRIRHRTNLQLSLLSDVVVRRGSRALADLRSSLIGSRSGRTSIGADISDPSRGASAQGCSGSAFGSPAMLSHYRSCPPTRCAAMVMEGRCWF